MNVDNEKVLIDKRLKIVRFANENNDFKGIKCKYQITARNVCTRTSIVAYCDEKSLTYTTIFLNSVLYPFLKQFKGLDLKKVTIQTDNGNEFTNRYKRTKGQDPKKSSFTQNYLQTLNKLWSLTKLPFFLIHFITINYQNYYIIYFNNRTNLVIIVYVNIL